MSFHIMSVAEIFQKKKQKIKGDFALRCKGNIFVLNISF